MTVGIFAQACLLAKEQSFMCCICCAGSVKSVLGEASKEVQAMYNKLPAKYARLCDMFGASPLHYLVCAVSSQVAFVLSKFCKAVLTTLLLPRQPSLCSIHSYASHATYSGP